VRYPPTLKATEHSPQGHTVIEEKMDGLHVGLYFERPYVLSWLVRNRTMTERLPLLKRWANEHIVPLWDALGDRYVMHGEWLRHTHTVYYDALPAYFLEFDIYDRLRQCWLSTTERAAVVPPFVLSVPVLYEGQWPGIQAARQLIGKSVYRRGVAPDVAGVATSNLAEGVYIKEERGACVVQRYKLIRETFLAVVCAADHWRTRHPPVLNRLRI